MTAEYPSNSRQPKPEPLEKEPITPVVSGPVLFKDKSVDRKLRDFLLAETPEQALQGVIFDVILPSVQDLILEASWGMLERMLGGSHRRPGGRGSTIPGMRPGSGPVAYSQMYKPQQAQPTAMDLVRRLDDQFKLQDIVMQDRGELEFVLEGVSDLIERYEQASVADLYSLLGRSAPYTYENWGWVDIRDATIRRLRGGQGFILDLPQPQPLK